MRLHEVDPTNIVPTCTICGQNLGGRSLAEECPGLTASAPFFQNSDGRKPLQYSHKRYEELVNETVSMVRQLSELKGGEYAGDTDRLANFRRNAEALGLDMSQVWAIYAAKHWDAVMQYVKDIGAGKKRERMESITGRLDDLIVYCILMKAIVEERERPQG